MSAAFLDVEDVLDLHGLQSEQFRGGTELRDRGLREFALTLATVLSGYRPAHFAPT